TEGAHRGLPSAVTRWTSHKTNEEIMQPALLQWGRRARASSTAGAPRPGMIPATSQLFFPSLGHQSIAVRDKPARLPLTIKLQKPHWPFLLEVAPYREGRLAWGMSFCAYEEMVMQENATDDAQR